MSVYETQHARGDCIAAHRHELGYAALVLDGAYDELSADGVWRVEAGDLVLHPSFHLHLNRFELGDARVLNVALPHALLRKLEARKYAVLRVHDPDRFARKAETQEIDAVGEALDDAAPCAPSAPRDWRSYASRNSASARWRVSMACRQSTRRGHLRKGSACRRRAIAPSTACRVRCVRWRMACCHWRKSRFKQDTPTRRISRATWHLPQAFRRRGCGPRSPRSNLFKNGQQCLPMIGA